MGREQKTSNHLKKKFSQPVLMICAFVHRRQRAYIRVSSLPLAHGHFEINVTYWMLLWGQSVPCGAQELSAFYYFLAIFL